MKRIVSSFTVNLINLQLLRLVKRFSNSGASPLGGHAMLNGTRMAQRNRYTFVNAKGNDLVHCEWGCDIYSLPMQGALQKFIEKHLAIGKITI